MEREERRNYFIIGSVIIEIVSPMFQRLLQSCYTNMGFMNLTDFLQCNIVLHILFHLRHKHAMCCKDRDDCVYNASLPLTYYQWRFMYSDNSLQRPPHHCFCKYTANSIQLDDLDITLSSLLLLNCCNLTQDNINVIQGLRQIKNDYFNNNYRGIITQWEYKTVWADITTSILRIDLSLEDDLVRLERRPLDEALCYKYSTEISGIHTKLEEIDFKFSRMELLLIENTKKLDDSMRMNSREKAEPNKQYMNNENEDRHMNNSSKVGRHEESSIEMQEEEFEMVHSGFSQEQRQNLEKVHNSTEQHLGIDHTNSHEDCSQNIKKTTTTEHEHMKACPSFQQVNEIRTLFNCSSEEEISNLENVQHAKEVNVSVEQKKEASFTIFSSGCNVSVGTIVMGNQNITVTSIDQIANTTSNSTIP